MFKDQERREGRDPSWPEGANLEICDEKFGQLGVNTEMFVVKGNMYGQFPSHHSHNTHIYYSGFGDWRVWNMR